MITVSSQSERMRSDKYIFLTRLQTDNEYVTSIASFDSELQTLLIACKQQRKFVLDVNSTSYACEAMGNTYHKISLMCLRLRQKQIANK